MPSSGRALRALASLALLSGAAYAILLLRSRASRPQASVACTEAKPEPAQAEPAPAASDVHVRRTWIGRFDRLQKQFPGASKHAVLAALQTHDGNESKAREELSSR